MHETVLELINPAIRDAFEASWQRGAPQRIEELLPDPTVQGYLPTLEELVRIDLERSWRNCKTRGNNDLPTVESYVTRFPALNERRRLTRLLRSEVEARKAA